MNSRKRDFRDRIYRHYYSAQVEQRVKDIHERIEEDKRSYECELRSLLPSNREVSILDVGCGFGSLLLYLQERGFKHTEGVDVSPEQVQQAKSMGLENVHHEDLFNYLNGDRRWDVITAVDLLEHFDRREVLDLLALIRDSLKPGGLLLARVPNVDAPFGSVFAYGDITHQIYLNASSAREILQASGFNDIELRSSCMEYRGVFRETLRKIIWKGSTHLFKLLFFASGRSMQNVILTPNIIFKARK